MIELNGVSAGYEGTTVLRNITLRVDSGQVVALLGPNGAGKTTLLRVASRLLQVDDGSLSLDGDDVTAMSPDRLARRGVCHIPEGRGIFRSLSVRENLALLAGSAHRGDAVARTVEIFPVLANCLDLAAGRLSGGQQQMVALSRAYMSNPRYILLDEISLGLAPVVVDAIFEFIATLRATGVGLLLVEQYVQRALSLADHVYLMSQGSVTSPVRPQDLDPDEVLRSYVGTAHRRAAGAGDDD
jgi:branched-chain amino acid transport system ATP-binding protein